MGIYILGRYGGIRETSRESPAVYYENADTLSLIKIDLIDFRLGRWLKEH